MMSISATESLCSLNSKAAIALKKYFPKFNNATTNTVSGVLFISIQIRFLYAVVEWWTLAYDSSK